MAGKASRRKISTIIFLTTYRLSGKNSYTHALMAHTSKIQSLFLPKLGIMKKVLVLIVLCLIGFASYWFFFRHKDGSSTPPPVPLNIASKTDAFAGSFGHVMETYYKLTDAFVKSDSNLVNTAGQNFKIALDSLNFRDVKADSSLIGTANSFKQQLGENVAELLQVDSLAGKRKSFKTISDALYNLVRTVKYDKAMVYQMHCPMAFDNTGADWLSFTPEVKNPYFGNTMLTCGEAVDSVDYRPAPPAIPVK